MKKVRVTASNGKVVTADGKLLNCIGNIPPRVGDYVWTDGRCVYGNVIECGEPFIPTKKIEKGLPIKLGSYDYTYFQNGVEKRKFKNIKITKPYLRFLNNKNRWILLEGYGGYDAEFAEDNNESIYFLTSGSYDSRIITEGYIGASGWIYKDDKLIGNYYSKLDGVLPSLGTDYEEYRFDAIPLYIFANGSYVVFASLSRYGLSNRESKNRVQIWASKEIILSSSGIQILRDYYNREDGKPGITTTKTEQYNDVKIPMLDNWYYIFSHRENYNNHFSVFDNEGNLQLEFNYNRSPCGLLVYKLKKEEFLVQFTSSNVNPSKILFYKNGSFETIKDTEGNTVYKELKSENLRLREMKDIEKWCREIKNFTLKTGNRYRKPPYYD